MLIDPQRQACLRCYLDQENTIVAVDAGDVEAVRSSISPPALQNGDGSSAHEAHAGVSAEERTSVDFAVRARAELLPLLARIMRRFKATFGKDYNEPSTAIVFTACVQHPSG